jgi:serine protease Do
MHLLHQSSQRTGAPERGPGRRFAAWLIAGLMGASALGLALQPWQGSALAETQADSVMTPYGAAPLSFADLVDHVKGSVVSVYIQGKSSGGLSMSDLPDAFPDLPDDHPLNEFFKRFKKEFGDKGGNEGANPRRPTLAQGSGFIISADGYVVTNNHVIDGADKIEVTIDENERFPAELIGTDPRTDLALLKIKSDRTFTPVKFADEPVRVGDWVIAVGNPFGLGGTVTAGIVSARGRDIGSGPYDYIQIDAAVNRGNSGGPAFNLKGEVIGVNTAIFSPSGGNVGIAFAVPADLARQVVEQLKTSGSVSRGWLGVQIQNVTEDIALSLGMDKPHGALVTQITKGGPAENSELKVGDAIVSVNGEKVENSRDLARKIAELAPNTDASIGVIRGDTTQQLTVRLGTFPSGKQLAKLEEGEVPSTTPETADMKDFGLSLAPASALAAQGGAAQDGVLITKVEADSEAAEKGLQSGDIILEVAGEKVMNPSEVVSTIEAAKSKGRKAVLLRVKSGDNERFIALAIKQG